METKNIRIRNLTMRTCQYCLYYVPFKNGRCTNCGNDID